MKKNVAKMMPCYSEHILPVQVPWSILISRFYRRLKNFILVNLIFACNTFMYLLNAV